MSNPCKAISQQKLYEILQNCKQIPKDDRLSLRKILKDGDEQLVAILSDFNNKKLQIRLRKYFQKCKENKHNQEGGRQKTVVDVRGLNKQQNPSYYRSAILSMEKQMRKTLNFNKAGNDFKAQLEQCRSLSNSKCEISKSKNNLISQSIVSPVEFKVDSRQNNPTKYTYEDNYLKQSQSNIFSPPQFLKWDSLKLATSIPASNITSMRNSVALVSSGLPSSNNTHEQSQFSSIFSRMRASIPGLPQNLQKTPQNDLYTLKSSLLKHYAQDIFDYIVHSHFPMSLNQKSVYFPYRQLLQQIQTYLRNKGQNLEIVKQSDIKIPLLQPFTNQYEGVSLKNLGIFLNKFCLHKNNTIRNVFIVLESSDKGNISIQKFRKINSWKGQELISTFEALVKKWGEGNAIGYWQVFRARREKQYLDFSHLYEKM